jgi:DNA invertase Pin-like site-specific DNA recombinase
MQSKIEIPDYLPPNARYYIYVIENQLDYKRYIGLTETYVKVAESGKIKKRTATTRWSEHQSDAKYGTTNMFIHQVMKAEGIENFAYYIIDAAETSQEICRLEGYWIALLGTCNRELGYNVHPGGLAGTHAPETKEKIRKALTGVKHSDERKRKISESKKGKGGIQGEGHSRTKLTKEQVLQIVELSKSHSQQEIGDMFEIRRHTVGQILNGRNWNHTTHIRKEDGTILTHKIHILQGSDHPNAFLNEEQVQKIIELAPDYKNSEIAKLLGITVHQVGSVLRGITWTHITGIGKQTHLQRPQRLSTAKLTEQQVLDVVELAGTHTQEEIAELIGMSRSNVANILQGYSWSHLTGITASQSLPRGSTHKMSKLTEAQVHQIVALSPTHTNQSLADMFGVKNKTISDITTGKTWRHITNIQPGNTLKGNAKLTAEQVLKIVELSETHSQNELANMFGLTQTPIWSILNGKSWSSITGIVPKKPKSQ